MARHGTYEGSHHVDAARRSLTLLEMELMPDGHAHVPDAVKLQVHLSQLAEALQGLEHVVELVTGA